MAPKLCDYERHGRDWTKVLSFVASRRVLWRLDLAILDAPSFASSQPLTPLEWRRLSISASMNLKCDPIMGWLVKADPVSHDQSLDRYLTRAFSIRSYPS